MALSLKSSNFYKFYKQNILNNVNISKVTSLAFISSEDSSETVPLPDTHNLSYSKLKDNVLNAFCAPTNPTCESILAGNPQSVDRRYTIRRDVIKKWEQKIDINLKTHPTILLGITMLDEVNKS